MNIIRAPHHSVTKREAAEVLGIQTYDTALPQPWLDKVAGNLNSLAVNENGKLYDILLSSLVWCYDGGSFTGYPYPLTLKAWAFLKAHDTRFGTHMVDELKVQFNVLDLG